jgi:hypothetical protein
VIEELLFFEIAVVWEKLVCERGVGSGEWG